MEDDFYTPNRRPAWSSSMRLNHGDRFTDDGGVRYNHNPARRVNWDYGDPIPEQNNASEASNAAPEGSTAANQTETAQPTVTTTASAATPAVEKIPAGQTFAKAAYSGTSTDRCYLCMMDFEASDELEEHVMEHTVHKNNMKDEQMKAKAWAYMKEKGVDPNHTIKLPEPEFKFSMSLKPAKKVEKAKKGTRAEPILLE